MSNLRHTPDGRDRWVASQGERLAFVRAPLAMTGAGRLAGRARGTGKQEGEALIFDRQSFLPATR